MLSPYLTDHADHPEAPVLPMVGRSIFVGSFVQMTPSFTLVFNFQNTRTQEVESYCVRLIWYSKKDANECDDDSRMLTKLLSSFTTFV